MSQATHRAPERVTITLPEQVKDLFAWLKAHDPQFGGTDAAIAAFLLEKGAEAYYSQGLEAITPLDNDVFNALAEHGIVGVRQAIAEPESEAEPKIPGKRAAGKRR